MKGRVFLIFMTLTILSACSSAEPPKGLKLNGYWITDTQNTAMLDPQTSGLVKWRDRLMTVSDGSAHKSQRLRLAQVSPDSAKLYPQSLKFEISDRVRQSCFVGYLSDEPDYEALVVDPQDDNVFIVVTEDATRTGHLSQACKNKYASTGSTDYPTLLVRLVLNQSGSLDVSHVRPVRFAPEFGVGNFPNDGIEGMAFGPENTLYLGLEKDQQGQPRIFSVTIDEDFWDSKDFVDAQDPQLRTPTFDSGNHPINGMSFYPHGTGQGYLVAAARNDEEIWFVDLDKQRETIVIPVHFMAQVRVPTEGCSEWELMDNASLEGVAVDGQTLWLVNDPWKRNYHKNIVCEANRANYEMMAPLLFKMDIDPTWFE